MHPCTRRWLRLLKIKHFKRFLDSNHVSRSTWTYSIQVHRISWLILESFWAVCPFFHYFWTGIPKLYFQNSVLCTVVNCNKLSLIFSFISINFQPMKLFLCHMSIPIFLKSSVNILTNNGLTFNKKFVNFIYSCVFKSLLCLLYKVIESKNK